MWKHPADGFSIVELVTVIVIIGVLIGIGVSRYNSFIAKARRAEAKTNLGTLWGLHESHKLEHGSVKASDLPDIGGAGEFCTPAAKKNALGFRPVDCTKIRYIYQFKNTLYRAWSKATNENNNIYPGCLQQDVIDIMKQTKQIKQDTVKDAIKNCE